MHGVQDLLHLTLEKKVLHADLDFLVDDFTTVTSATGRGVGTGVAIGLDCPALPPIRMAETVGR